MRTLTFIVFLAISLAACGKAENQQTGVETPSLFDVWESGTTVLDMRGGQVEHLFDARAYLESGFQCRIILLYKDGVAKTVQSLYDPPITTVPNGPIPSCGQFANKEFAVAAQPQAVVGTEATEGDTMLACDKDKKSCITFTR